MIKVDLLQLTKIENKLSNLESQLRSLPLAEILASIKKLEAAIKKNSIAPTWQDRQKRRLSKLKKEVARTHLELSIDALFDAAQKARAEGDLASMEKTRGQISLLLSERSAFPTDDDLLLRAALQLVSGDISIPFPRFSHIDGLDEWVRLDLSL